MWNRPPKPDNELSDPPARREMTIEDLRRAAECSRDRDDSLLKGQAWDEPAPAPKPPARTFGQLPDLHVPEDFDEPLTDAENAVWEADSAD